MPSGPTRLSVAGDGSEVAPHAPSVSAAESDASGDAPARSDVDPLYDPGKDWGIVFQRAGQDGPFILLHKDFYGPLDPAKGEIRVLVVRPGNPDDPLEGTLVKTELHGNLVFHALSYTWGDPADPVIIKLNNHDVPVTRNLAAALTSFRQPDAPIILWVDAICINQKDDAEKSHQVQRMRDIYQTAVDVWIWLGPEFDDWYMGGQDAVKNAFEWLRRLPSIDLSNREERESMYNAEIGQALRQLMKAPWWRRVWIIQEAVVNERTIVFCGKKMIQFEFFQVLVAVMLSYLRSGVLLSGMFHYMLQLSESENWTMLAQIRGGWQGRAQLNLKDLIFLTYLHVLATDPRDRFYALLGLASEEDAKELVPDYALDKATVFCKATTHLIRRHESLDILQLGEQLHRSADLPSWMPAWDMERRAKKPRPRLEGRASNSIPWDLDVSPNLRILTISGFSISEVVFAAAFEPQPGVSDQWNSWSPPQCVYEWYQKLDEEDSTIPELYFGICSKKEAFARTLIANTVIRESDANSMAEQQTAPYDPDELVRQFDNWMGTSPGSGRTRMLMEGGGWIEASDMDYTSVMRPASAYRREALRYLGSRTFVILKNGRIGIAPEDARVGDVAVLISRCSTPICLRPEGGHFSWVGAMYLHGLMGEHSVRFDLGGIRRFEIR